MTDAEQTIGPYEIVQQVGSGGMATVYKAYQAKLDRYVAIKIMHKNFSQDPLFQARFEREARIVAQLDHPNIVPIYDYDEIDGQTYLVMKYVEGLTLKQLLRKETMSYAEILELLTPIAQALTYAHTQGVLHRDIKPSNIILNHRGIPYLTDFGLARVAQQGESTMSTDMMLGTPQYMSPEQARGDDLDARTDVYSLGIVLYELTVGQVPFIGSTSYGIIHDQIYSPPPKPRELNPEITPELEAILLKALAKSPEQRYDTPNALIEAFRSAVDGAPVASPPPETDYASEEKNSAVPTDTAVEPMNMLERFVRGIETFGEEMDAGFRGFDRDAFGRKLSEEEMREKGKSEAPRIIKSAIQAGFTAAKTGETPPRMRRSLDPEAARIEEERMLRERVEKRIKEQQDERNGLIWHIAIFLLINYLFLGLDDMLAGQFAINCWTGATLLWGFGLAAHLLDYYNKYGGGRRRLEARIDRELERERQRMYGYDYAPAKAKNEDYEARQVRLTADGELSESFIEEQGHVDKRKNR